MQPETVKDLLDRYGYALRSYPEQSFLAMQGEMCRSLFILCHGHINALMINHEGRQIIVEQFTDWSVLAPAFLLATHHVALRSACAEQGHAAQDAACRLAYDGKFLARNFGQVCRTDRTTP